MSTGAAFGARTTLRVGGEAARVIDIASFEELERVVEELAPHTPVFVLGRGSNTLVSDAGFPGIVLHLGEGFSDISIEGTTVRSGAAVDLPVLARRSVEAGLAGFEWAVGVPGSVGGAVAMNAGGHGSDMAASVVEVTVMDLDTGAITQRDREGLTFSYRHSSIGQRELVLAARLELRIGDQEASRSLLREIVKWRREHQPGGANCGSVFTNPDGDSAGRLIEAAGLRGRRHGTAAVSDKHANFIQADAGGAADDVAALMEEVVQSVEKSSGVRLRSEVRLVGFAPEVRASLSGGSDT